MTKNGYNILMRCVEVVEERYKDPSARMFPETTREPDKAIDFITALPVFELPKDTVDILKQSGVIDAINECNSWDEATGKFPPPFPDFTATRDGCSVVARKGRPIFVGGIPLYETFPYPYSLWGSVRASERKEEIVGQLFGFNRAFKLMEIKDMTEEQAEGYLNIAGQFILEASALVSHAGTWAVEVSPVKQPKTKARFTRRLHERNRIQIWMDKKVNESFRSVRVSSDPLTEQELSPDFEEEDVDYTIAAHRRRGYWRTLRSSRYTHMQGQRQWINATWVGPREMVYGQNHYEVRLDL